MILNIGLVIGGIFLLVKGADFLVSGSSAIAQRLHISKLVIGLTLVAFGTSAPELAVNMLSAISGNAEIALGNINGSNIANIMLILGAAGLFTTIHVRSRTIVKEIPFMLLSGVVLVVMMLDGVLAGQPALLTRSEGILMLIFASIFLYYLFLSAKDINSVANVEVPKVKLAGAIIMSLGGLVALVFGAKLTVDGAVGIAEWFNVSQTLIALTVVAIGTSLPELVTAITAARKGEVDLVVGNVVGSNIFNILLVIGMTASISPVAIQVTGHAISDAIVAVCAMLLLVIFVLISKLTGKQRGFYINRVEGAILILGYICYLVFIAFRG
ncbi:calcium/sodium antiporter [Patescibacteria group bacterium]|nr:calcium/sodium antiporter [Patescibacteria group bacterium]